MYRATSRAETVKATGDFIVLIDHWIDDLKAHAKTVLARPLQKEINRFAKLQNLWLSRELLLYILQILLGTSWTGPHYGFSEGFESKSQRVVGVKISIKY